jgi:hypothetical protein
MWKIAQLVHYLIPYPRVETFPIQYSASNLLTNADKGNYGMYAVYVLCVCVC